MSSHTGVLEHYQDKQVRPSTHLRDADADFLVTNLVAERISRKLIRMLAPSSVFLQHRPLQPGSSRYIPTTLPPSELPGYRFQLPQNPLWQDQHAAHRRSLQIRARLMMESWKHCEARIVPSPAS